MDTFLIILLAILISLCSLIIYLQLKSKPKQADDSVDKIQQEINSLRHSLNESFGSMSKDIT